MFAVRISPEEIKLSLAAAIAARAFPVAQIPAVFK
jgi:hypothetical protein